MFLAVVRRGYVAFELCLKLVELESVEIEGKGVDWHGTCGQKDH